jgi:predicted RNase H-like nuclease (RuvC/YqgF family)
MPPTLTEVLASGSYASNLPQEIFRLTVILAAVGAGVITLAKGLRSDRRQNSLRLSWEKQNEERIEKLNFMVDELKRERDALAQQKAALEKQLENFAEQKQLVESLRKSNLTLMRECERLKWEKEELALKSSPSLLRSKKQFSTAAATRREKPKRTLKNKK